MKKAFLTAGLAVMLAAAPAMAGTVTPAHNMMQQQPTQQQPNPYQMNQGMMGGYGYGYGMGPGMMGGYGMGPGMMGGYGMGPGMMGGYGMGPGMMGGYGYGMGPGMMGGYGMGPACGAWQRPNFRSPEEYGKFMDDTREQRRKLHNLMFDYGETMRSPEPDREKLRMLEQKMNELRDQIYNYNSK